ncbi:hypothetical protein [Microbacterium sp. NPDC087665]|uniref:hypothetical protein n=1 Tax=Microbacterium sp. NPDC087665 TaxID=3364194 RepID=UPI003828EB44
MSVETMSWLGMLRRMIRAAGRRVAEADEPELATLLALRDELDAAIASAVDGQHASGRSWEAIGKAAGLTRQGAFQRWGQRRTNKGIA